MVVSNPDGSQSTQKRASASFKTGLKTFQLVCGEKCFKEEDLLDVFSPSGFLQYRDSCITKWKKKPKCGKEPRTS
jgi:hypothetical protein